jgi:hypothetical protein
VLKHTITPVFSELLYPLKSAIGSQNQVRGRPGWYYSVFLMHDDGTCSFSEDSFAPGGGHCIENLRASKYRTTRLARSMRDRENPGYEVVARRAIDNADRKVKG